MKKPKISIIIPTYNASQTLPTTLESIFKQDFRDFEVVVINDGSSDKTAEIVQNWQKKRKKIKYFYQDNKGLAGARNAGIRNSQGEYFLFLDADDFIKPSHLANLWQKTESFDQKKIAFSDTRYLMAGRILKRSYRQISGFKEGEGPKEFLPRNYMPGIHSILFPRGAFAKIGLFDQNLVGAEDHDLYIRLVLVGYRFFNTGNATSIYQIREGSMSFGLKQQKRLGQAELQISKKYLKWKLKPQTRKAFLRKKQNAYIKIGSGCLREKDFNRAHYYFKKATKVPVSLHFKKRILVILQRYFPAAALVYWKTKDDLWPSELQLKINKYIGKEKYEAQS